MGGRGFVGKSGFDAARKRKDLLPFGAKLLGQPCPQSCPQHCLHPENADSLRFSEPLGEPLTIREVAGIIGCSPWTVRQRYVPLGLPHLRSRPNGKLIFYKNQVIHWLLTQQQKGGTTT